MRDIRRNCKYCNSETVVSDKEDGFYHAFEINGDLHNCRSKRRGYPVAMAGHHGFSYFPPAIYADLVVLSRQNDLSVKELEVMFVRYWVEKITERKCDHPPKKLKYDKDREKDKWHCTQCWRRFDRKESITYENAKVVKKTYYEPVKTYIDRLVAEAEHVTEANKQQFPEETKVLGKLVPND